MVTLFERHAPTDVVAYGSSGERTLEELLHDASVIAEALPAHVRAGAEVLLVFRQDRYAFAAALLAAWARGCTALLPSDTGREAVLALASREQTAFILHDTPSGAPLRVDTLLAEKRAATPLPKLALAHDPLALCFRADAACEPLEKHSSVLFAEATALVQIFGFAPGTRVVSTLTPGEAYGFLFGVLLPLCRGGAFSRAISADPELVASQLAPSGVHWLVSTPFHLRRLSQAAPGVFARAERVFSALAPLHPHVREAVRACGGPEISEVVTEPGRASGESADPSGLLAGLEAFLAGCPGVADAAVVSAPGADADKPRLLAVVQGQGLSEAALSEALRARFSAAVVPERMLQVDKIARDDSGVLRRARVLRLFGLCADGRPVNDCIEFREGALQRDGEVQQYVCTAEVAADYAYFDGHFPGYPILPGAAQLSELVLPCVRRVRPDLGAVTQLSRLKFLGRIQPGEAVEVVLRYREADRGVEFTLRRGETVCAAGHIAFAGQEET